MDTLDYDRDRQLVARAARADRGALHQIVERYQGRVYRLVYRMVGDVEVARDLTQETFLRALERMDGLQDGRALHRWLSQVATNLVRDLWRTRKDVVGFDESDPRLTPAFPLPSHQAEARETGERIQAALMRLPLVYRQAFVLRHVEELEYEEISAALEIGIAALKVRVHRACRMLRQLLPEYTADTDGVGEDDS